MKLSKASEAVIKLANQFEAKLSKYAQEVSQEGTTELFFGDGGAQQSFATAVQDTNGAIAKLLLAAATKTGKSSSFDLKVSAEPKVGAKWVLTVVPLSLHKPVWDLMNIAYKKMKNVDMMAQMQQADKAAKAGSGSGTNDVASLNIDM